MRASLPGSRRLLMLTSGLNVGSALVASIGGLLIARLLGASLRGDYAAIVAWYGVALTVGELGQPAAIVYYAARHPVQARDYVATSRALMLVSGTVVAAGGWFLATGLAGPHPHLVTGYRLAFLACPVIFLNASYGFALQARSIARWAVVKAIQPALYLVGILLLVPFRISVQLVVLVLIGSSVVQLVFSYLACRGLRLTAGRPRASLLKPIVTYGLTQIAATTPTTVNVYLDQLILSQAVPAADLGRYAVAVSATSVAYPLVTPIGSILFPRIAAGNARGDGSAPQQWRAIVASLAVSAGIMAALAAVSPFLVPTLLGRDYEPAVNLIWILCPAGVLLPCNQVIGDMLRGHNRTRRVAVAQFVGAAVTIPSLAVLIPVMGVAGAAVTTSAAYLITFAVLVHALRGAARESPGEAPPRLPTEP